jgi:hypothetical protein
MSSKSSYSNDSYKNKKFTDSIPCRINFIKQLVKNNNISPLVNFNNTDTEYYVGSKDRDENGSGESYDTRVVLQKKLCDFTNTIMKFGGDEEQLEYIKSGTTGHTFRGTVIDEHEKFQYAVKVVAYPKKEKYGDMYDVRRPENAELKMIRVLSYFVVKRQTPHVVLPVGTFDTDIKIFTENEFMDVVGEDNDKYQEFLTKYNNGDYYDKASVLISEWANRGDLLDFMRKFYNTPQFVAIHWKSIFFQILSVLAVIQSKYPAFRHNDLKANNILVHKITKQDENFTYRIARKKYKVKNIGYQIKLWDFDFACIPGIVDNKKVCLEWTKAINVTPKQNKYYDVHYFFNTLIKRGFVSGIMTSNKVPQEVKDFINRILPKKYQNDPKASDLKKIINMKLQEKYEELYNNNLQLYNKTKKKEYHTLINKYKELYDKCEDSDFGGKYIHNYYIPSDIKHDIKNIIPPAYNDVLLGYVHEKGRLLIDDEYLTPLKILEEDPYFEEFRYFEEKEEKQEKQISHNNNYKNNNIINKTSTTPDLSKFLKNKSEIINEKKIHDNKKTHDNILKFIHSKPNGKKKKNTKKSRTISDDIKNINKVTINDIFA